MTPPAKVPRSRTNTTALVVFALLLLVLHVGLVAALLTGLATFTLYQALLRELSRAGSTTHRVAAWGALAITALVLLIVGGAIAEAIRGGWASSESLPRLLAFLADALDRLRASLPAWLAARIPDSTDALRQVGAEWLRTHAAHLQHWGQSALRIAAQMLVGAVIGLLCAFERRPAFRVAWAVEAQRLLAGLGEAFSRVVTAQVRIAAVNTVLTGIFLLVALPLAGVHLPFARTLVAATFVVGFIPIVGNLLSNGAILLAGLAVSPGVALGALVFLVGVHKLEYFLNAHIVGGTTEVPPAVLLGAMLLFEAVFGVGGLVAAPIYCAWVFLEFGLVRPRSPDPADGAPP